MTPETMQVMDNEQYRWDVILSACNRLSAYQLKERERRLAEAQGEIEREWLS